MQIAILSKNNKNNILKSLVSMFGDPFFTALKKIDKTITTLFSSPCLGILFSLRISMVLLMTVNLVFVPMFGDSFFTAGLRCPTGWVLYGPFAAGISN